ncbi:kinase [Candidatus Moduliflexus flocculans]|uniref:Kinase n=1 Tax=Candidatus Moduliflexus flocculans TaxID=1499966 RepID=A0A081BRD0_9BACT|nr:kinase [Candidatus Moduliflexus flocculans]
MKPRLFIFSGLPGTGKTTLAKAVAKSYKAAYLRLDTIEHGLTELCHVNVQGEGYRLSYRIASDNLLIGNHVVADCCNPWDLTRKEWEDVATQHNGEYINIEVLCSDKAEHRTRIETRENDIRGFVLPDWENVQNREQHAWRTPIIQIETAGRRAEECIKELLRKIEMKTKELA